VRKKQWGEQSAREKIIVMKRQGQTDKPSKEGGKRERGIAVPEERSHREKADQTPLKGTLYSGTTGRRKAVCSGTKKALLGDEKEKGQSGGAASESPQCLMGAFGGQELKSGRGMLMGRKCWDMWGAVPPLSNKDKTNATIAQ